MKRGKSVLDALRAWFAADALVIALKSERDGFRCESKVRDETPPCYRGSEREDFCDNCKKSEPVHQKLVTAKRKRGNALATLRRACGRTDLFKESAMALNVSGGAASRHLEETT